MWNSLLFVALLGGLRLFEEDDDDDSDLPPDEEIICPGSVHLFFANGMQNSIDEAKLSLNTLVNLTKDKTKNDTSIKWTASHLAYNFNKSFFSQLMDAYLQKKYEKLDNYYRWLERVEDSPEWFKKEVDEELWSLQMEMKTGENLEEQVEKYQDILESKGKILTVAHSQGNFFTNNAFNILNGKGEIRMIGVANPASSVFGGGPYFTLHSDGIINAIRNLALKNDFEKPLPANKTNYFPIPGTYDHGFVSHYLRGRNTGEEIIESVVENLKELSQTKSYEKKVKPFCRTWFEEIDAPKNLPSACLIKCNGTKISMKTFQCPRYCDYLCKCELR